MSGNELKHYGVLGMKWGMRRYQNKDGSLTPAGIKRYGKDGSARYTSWSTKRLSRAAESEKEERRAKASQDFDDAYAAYAKRTTIGKAVVGNVLMRPFRYKTYAMARAAGESRGKAAVRAVFDLGFGYTPLIPQGVSIQRRNIRENYIKEKSGISDKEIKQLKKARERWDKDANSNVAGSAVGDTMRLYRQLSKDAKAEKQATKGMSRSEKKQLQKDRNEYMQFYIEAHNNVAAKLNPKVDEFNAKWAKEFEGYRDWSKSPKWEAYQKAIADQYDEAMEKEMERLYKQKYGD